MVKHMQCSIWCNPRSLLHSDTRINTLTQTSSWGVGGGGPIYWADSWSAAKEELVLWTCRRTSGFCTAWHVGLNKIGMDRVLLCEKPQLFKKKRKERLSLQNEDGKSSCQRRAAAGISEISFWLKLRSSTGHHRSHNMQFSLHGDYYSELHNFLSMGEGDGWWSASQSFGF